MFLSESWKNEDEEELEEEEQEDSGEDQQAELDNRCSTQKPDKPRRDQLCGLSPGNVRLVCLFTDRGDLAMPLGLHPTCGKSKLNSVQSAC